MRHPHRRHTDYSAQGRQDDIGAFDSPKYLGVEVCAVSKVGADHFDMMTDAPLANGDGLNYMNKRTSVGIGVIMVQKLGGRARRASAGASSRTSRSAPCQG